MIMRFITTVIFMLSCKLSFALNIRDVDLMNNNPIGSIIADVALVFFLAVFCLYIVIRLIHVVFRKKYTFEKETALAHDRYYLKEWLRYKSIMDNHYVSTTMAEINAFENMQRMKENKMIRIVEPGSKYTKCSLNVFSDYQKIRLVEDNKIYYMFCN